ncbi:hypothetical protein PRO82_000247 [Candidatus Protochlamydia amoebophila]|nr:hypothetical protein [Candidatus Protochlamydia amoebophila]
MKECNVDPSSNTMLVKGLKASLKKGLIFTKNIIVKC